MPLLHLIDRPESVSYGLEERRQGLGTFASGVTHLAASVLVALAIQTARDVPIETPSPVFDAQRLVWPTNSDLGGGRRGGGDTSNTPARQQRMPGSGETALPPAQRASPTTTEPLTEPLPFTPVSVGSAADMLVGAIASDSASDALGARDGPGGDGSGPTTGAGNTARNGIGDGPRAGMPGVTTPVPIVQVKPQYTADAMRAKVQGVVTIECVVLPDGTVGEARVSRSLDPAFGLDQEAIAAARRWRFKPGLLNGTPTPVIVSIELAFTLR